MVLPPRVHLDAVSDVLGSRRAPFLHQQFKFGDILYLGDGVLGYRQGSVDRGNFAVYLVLQPQGLSIQDLE